MVPNLEQFATRCDAMRWLGAKGLIMKLLDFVHRWTMLLLLFIGLTTPLSASHANSQIVVFNAPTTDSGAESGLAKTAADAFQSRLNQMNFIVLDPVILSRKAGIIGTSRAEVLSRLPAIRSHYGDVLIIFLQSRLHLPANRNAYLQSDATVVSSATASQVVSSHIDGDGFLLPRDCDADCAQILGTRAARQIAETLAMRIGKLISNPSGAMADGGDPIKKVQIDLVNFNQAQRTQFIDLMVNEFPGFLKIVNMQHAGPHTRFAYYSEAPNIKLQKWIDISLRDIGINPETGADVLVKPGTIQIVLTATGSSRGSAGNPLKYN
jgi:hypothetical protein